MADKHAALCNLVKIWWLGLSGEKVHRAMPWFLSTNLQHQIEKNWRLDAEWKCDCSEVFLWADKSTGWCSIPLRVTLQHTLPWSPRMQSSMKKHLLRGWKVGQLCLAAVENIHHSSPQVNSCHLWRDRMWWKIGKKPLYFYLFLACHPAAALTRPSIRASAKIAHVMMHWLVCRLNHGRLHC